MKETINISCPEKTDVSTLIEIGQKIKLKRKKLKMTQGELAEKVGLASFRPISEVENGKINAVSQEKMDRIAIELDLKFKMDVPRVGRDSK